MSRFTNRKRRNLISPFWMWQKVKPSKLLFVRTPHLLKHLFPSRAEHLIYPWRLTLLCSTWHIRPYLVYYHSAWDHCLCGFINVVIKYKWCIMYYTENAHTMRRRKCPIKSFFQMILQKCQSISAKLEFTLFSVSVEMRPEGWLVPLRGHKATYVTHMASQESWSVAWKWDKLPLG